MCIVTLIYRADCPGPTLRCAKIVHFDVVNDWPLNLRPDQFYCFCTENTYRWDITYYLNPAQPFRIHCDVCAEYLHKTICMTEQAIEDRERRPRAKAIETFRKTLPYLSPNVEDTNEWVCISGPDALRGRDVRQEEEDHNENYDDRYHDELDDDRLPQGYAGRAYYDIHAPPRQVEPGLSNYYRPADQYLPWQEDAFQQDTAERRFSPGEEEDDYFYR